MDHEQNKENMNNQGELKKCQQEKEEYLNNWKRERADFVNYKKDEDKRIDRAREFGKRVVLEDILDVRDGLEKVSDSGDPNDDYIIGIKTILGQLDRLFKMYKVEKIKVGKDFDPTMHEAIEMEPEGEKIIEVRTGYTMNGDLIRPAKVKIIK